MNYVKMLYELQEKSEKVEVNKKITLDGSYLYLLRKMKKEFEEYKEIYNSKCKEIDNIKNEYETISAELKTVNTKIENDENHLYNNSNNDLKAINALESNIKTNKATLKLLEDKAIVLLETEEKLKIDIENSKVELLTVKNNFYSYKETTSKKIQDAKQEILQLNNEIDELKKEIPENYLIEYSEIAAQKKKPIAKIHGSVCSGCKMKVSAMTMDKLYKKDEIVHCDNCGRVLLMDEIDNLKEAR